MASILAAPSSGSGKTVVALALLRRAASRRGVRVAAAKSGPDYIDAAFLARGDRRALPQSRCLGDAARDDRRSARVVRRGRSRAVRRRDGAVRRHRRSGRRLDRRRLRAFVGWPVVLVVDAAGAGASVAALVEGFARHRPETRIAGLILNRVGSARHRALLADALARDVPEVPLLGALSRDPASGSPVAPSRPGAGGGASATLDALLARAAEKAEAEIDVARLLALAAPAALAPRPGAAPLPPLGQRIAVARDRGLCVRLRVRARRLARSGRELELLLAACRRGARAIVRCGLSAGRLSRAARRHARRRARASAPDCAMQPRAGRAIYGECGGYMALGRALTRRRRARATRWRDCCRSRRASPSAACIWDIARRGSCARQRSAPRARAFAATNFITRRSAAKDAGASALRARRRRRRRRSAARAASRQRSWARSSISSTARPDAAARASVLARGESSYKLGAWADHRSFGWISNRCR